jgi:hypothetical protein
MLLRRCLPYLVLVFSLASYVVLRFNVMKMMRYTTELCSTTTAKANAVTSASELETSSPTERQGFSSSSPLPQIVWLASYPNSGTSYTMTMVQRATNLATATQYGGEVVTTVPVDQQHVQEDPTPVLPLTSPNGPFWDAHGKVGTKRSLPTKFIMTKTHCGGRCVNCPASEYYVIDAASIT